jgi:hypothetical protein
VKKKTKVAKKVIIKISFQVKVKSRKQNALPGPTETSSSDREIHLPAEDEDERVEQCK